MKGYEKLRLEDINIKSPGQQIKSLIIGKYGSLDEFSERIGLYPVSVNQYLSSRTLGSSTFKIKLTNELDMNFEDMYESEEQQIQGFVSQVNRNIEKYNQNKDEQVIEKLKNICFEREMLDEYISICRAYGTYYYNKNEFDRALAYMELVINYLRHRQNISDLLIAMSEAAKMYAKMGNYQKLNQATSSIRKNLQSDQKFEDDCLYKIYYNVASGYSYSKNYEEAIKMYEKSLDYAAKRTDKGMSRIQIAHQLRVMGRLDESIEIYKVASRDIDVYEPEMNKIYRGFALIYLQKSDYQKAGIFADKMMAGIDGHICSTENDYLRVFAQIKLKLGLEGQILEKIQELLDEEKLDYIYMSYHIDQIEDIIVYAKGRNKFLEELMNILIENVKKNPQISKSVSSKLKTFIGEIVIQMQY